MNASIVRRGAAILTIIGCLTVAASSAVWAKARPDAQRHISTLTGSFLVLTESISKPIVLLGYGLTVTGPLPEVREIESMYASPVDAPLEGERMGPDFRRLYDPKRNHGRGCASGDRACMRRNHSALPRRVSSLLFDGERTGPIPPSMNPADTLVPDDIKKRPCARDGKAKAPCAREIGVVALEKTDVRASKIAGLKAVRAFEIVNTR